LAAYTIITTSQPKKIWNLQHLGLLLLVTCICYWPLAFGIFTVKNDNITAFLPTRYHVVEALRSGHLPLWSPYLYLGYPLHGDMQGGAWNPVVWLLSLTGRYDLTSMHLEILIAIFVSGAGMYRLLKTQSLNAQTCVTGAVAYMMCGFVTDVGGSNLPFLWGAAWIPFVIAYAYELLRRPSLRYTICAAMTMALLLACAYPSFVILTVYILFAGLLFRVITAFIAKDHIYLKKLALYQTVGIIVFVCLAAPVLMSYLHALPLYDRGSGVDLKSALYNSLDPRCLNSILFPGPTFRDPDVEGTDLIMRNVYFNLFFLMLLVSYAWQQKRKLLNFTFAGVLFFLLFALGEHTPLRGICYQLFPLMDTFRHPANARLFVILGSIFIGACMLEKMLQSNLHRRRLRATAVFFLILSLVFSFKAMRENPFSKSWDVLTNAGEQSAAGFKLFLDSLRSSDILLVICLLQLAFLLVFLFLTRKKNSSSLIWLFILNSFFCAQLAIPFTLVGKTSPKAGNSILKTYPKGFPPPGNHQTIGEASINATAHFDTIGMSGFYSKNIMVTTISYTPTMMKLFEDLAADSSAYQNVLSHPYVYLNNDSVESPTSTSGEIILKKFTNNLFVFETHSAKREQLVLQQLRLPGWRCYVDGKPAEIELVDRALMAVNLPEGNHEVEFHYRPTAVIICLYISLFTLIATIFLSVKRRSGKHA